jgi:hypothetical protein
VNNKIVFFFLAFSAISFAELSQWEIPANILHEESSQNYAGGLASAKSDLQANDVRYYFGNELPVHDGDTADAASPASVRYPVITILLGCALIGLVGLERKKMRNG